MDIERIASVAINVGFRVLKGLGPGLIMNFGGEMFKDGLRRIVNGHDDGRANMLRREHGLPPSRA